MAEPVVKKRKLEQENVSRVFETFHTLYEEADMANLRSAFKDLCDKTSSFRLKICSIKNSNATLAASFKAAFLDVQEHIDDLYPIGAIFITGLKLLRNFLKLKEIPQEEPFRGILASLLIYLLNKDMVESLGSLHRHCTNEQAVTLLVLNHLLLQVTPPTKCLIDGKYNWHLYCPDMCKYDLSMFRIDEGDTSIGNPNVWHGYIDAMIGKPTGDAALALTAIRVDDHDDDESEGSPGFRSCIEVKKSFVDADAPNLQIASQAIVFSFLQRRLHPDRKNALVPTIGISGTEIVVYFYDSENDILLQSVGGFSFREAQQRIGTILIAWLIVNYKYFCNGFVEVYKDAPKANFFEVCKEKIDVYKHNVMHGGVGKCQTNKSSLFKYGKATVHVTPALTEIDDL